MVKEDFWIKKAEIRRNNSYIFFFFSGQKIIKAHTAQRHTTVNVYVNTWTVDGGDKAGYRGVFAHKKLTVRDTKMT